MGSFKNKRVSSLYVVIGCLVAQMILAAIIIGVLAGLDPGANGWVYAGLAIAAGLSVATFIALIVVMKRSYTNERLVSASYPR